MIIGFSIISRAVHKSAAQQQMRLLYQHAPRHKSLTKANDLGRNKVGMHMKIHLDLAYPFIIPSWTLKFLRDPRSPGFQPYLKIFVLF